MAGVQVVDGDGVMVDERAGMEAMPQGDALGIPGVITPTGLTLPEEQTFGEWLEVGETLKTIHGATQWWLGDWLNTGERRYGEMYSQALDATDYAYQTLRDAAWVAGKVELSRRRDSLSWSHHKEVAACEPDEQEMWLELAEREGLPQKALRQRIREARAAVTIPDERPDARIACADWHEWLTAQEPCDLLLTDPPYMTDVDDIAAFAADWLPAALAQVRSTGRAYVCIGPYPEELDAYLAAATGQSMALEQVLVWTYRNTLGPCPAMKYKLNWQAILDFIGPEAPALDCPSMVEQFSVQDVNAPDGRQGDRYHTWQKPDELAERFVRHSTRPGALVLDPFAGTGTFLLAAAHLGRRGLGCERDPDMVSLALSRGCVAW